ncbi:hypothetical protein AURDEDRAFT_185721, partial [Auricularia subglabra TFB-10046 SS5]
RHSFLGGPPTPDSAPRPLPLQLGTPRSQTAGASARPAPCVYARTGCTLLRRTPLRGDSCLAGHRAKLGRTPYPHGHQNHAQARPGPPHRARRTRRLTLASVELTRSRPYQARQTQGI